MNITNVFPKKWRPYAKAIIAVLVVFLTALGAAFPDGVTGAEWIGILLTTLTGGGSVYATRNDPVPAGDGETHPDG